MSAKPASKGSDLNQVGQFNLVIPAGSATPAPPIGPALGQRGVNIPEFCKQFNAATAKMEKGMPIPTVISFNRKDKTFSFILKTPPASYLIKKAAKLDKGAKEPQRTNVGTITKSDARKIAEMKMQDMNANSLDAATMIIIGTAQSMGIDVIE